MKMESNPGFRFNVKLVEKSIFAQRQIAKSICKVNWSISSAVTVCEASVETYLYEYYHFDIPKFLYAYAIYNVLSSFFYVNLYLLNFYCTFV